MKAKILLSLFLSLVLFAQCSSKEDIENIPLPPKTGNYEPANPDGIEGDIKIKVAKGKASTAQNGEGIEKSFDGDVSTIYHSPWYDTEFPVTLEYIFEQAEDIDYIVYLPRASGDNGVFGKFELWVAKQNSTSYTKVEDYDFGERTSLSTITFPATMQKVTAFKFVVNTGYNDLVSCAELEFFRFGGGIEGLSEIFADDLCTALKSGVGQEQISSMKNAFFKAVAQSMFDKTYPQEFRIQEYEAYPTIETTAKNLKISGYNPFENPTGMYFSSGSEIVVLVGDAKGETISLRIHDFNSHTDGYYNLHRGINKIKISNSGLGYIVLFTDNYETISPVKIHILSAKVNGYFDKNRHKREDWDRLLNASVASFFDIKGDYINLAFTTTELQQYCNNGLELINIYDNITRSEHEIMGLVKYDKVPKNHMFARTVESGLFADGWGAGFAKDAMHELASPEKAKTVGCWAIAHELGHVNQIRPGLKWVSTTEVTNNVYSVVARYHYTPNDMPLEHERVNDGDNNHVLGGRFNSYLNYGVVKGEQWLCQRGQDKMEGYENGGDHFVKLCPLWQLMLYYRIAENTPWRQESWYADVAEIVRKTNESNMSNGQLQLNFMRNTIDVVQEDLTDFFIKAGMLKPIDKELDDYSRGHLTITQKDCDQLIAYAGKYRKPESPAIYYLSANSLDAYQKRMAVSGLFNQGINMDESSNTCTISHNVWKNAAVFETYKGDKLEYVAMVGTDSPDRSTTLLRYPAGSTRIEAVAWDGQRTLVYGQR